MPLSEEENRILREIEQQLYQSDPELARQVRTTTVYSAPASRLRFASVGLVLALLLTVYLLTVHYLAAFGGFLLCFGLGMMVESSMRAIGKAGVADLSSQVRAGQRSGSGKTSGDSDTDRIAE